MNNIISYHIIDKYFYLIINDSIKSYCYKYHLLNFKLITRYEIFKQINFCINYDNILILSRNKFKPEILYNINELFNNDISGNYIQNIINKKILTIPVISTKLNQIVITINNQLEIYDLYTFQLKSVFYITNPNSYGGIESITSVIYSNNYNLLIATTDHNIRFIDPINLTYLNNTDIYITRRTNKISISNNNLYTALNEYNENSNHYIVLLKLIYKNNGINKNLINISSISTKKYYLSNKNFIDVFFEFSKIYNNLMYIYINNTIKIIKIIDYPIIDYIILYSFDISFNYQINHLLDNNDFIYHIKNNENDFKIYKFNLINIINNNNYLKTLYFSKKKIFDLPDELEIRIVNYIQDFS